MKPKVIKLNIDFRYVVLAKMTERHKKIVHRICNKTTIATVKKVSRKDAPIAFVVKDYKSLVKGATSFDDFNDESKKHVSKIVAESIRKFNGKFYNPLRYSSGVAISDRFMDVDFFVQHEVNWRVRCWDDRLINNIVRNAQSTEAKGVPQVFISNNYSEAINTVQSILDDFIYCDGKFWVVTSPPVYTYKTFGLRHNHGGTGFFIEYLDISRLTKEQKRLYFTPSQRDKAIKTVIKVAAERGDTNDVKRFQHISENIIICK